MISYRLAIQANSCHLCSEANRLVIDVSQAVCPGARDHQLKTLRFLQDWTRGDFSLGEEKRRRNCWIPVGISIGGRTFTHGLPGLVRALGNPGRSVMSTLPCWQKVARSPPFASCWEGARLDPPGWPVLSIKITLYLSVPGLWEREKSSGALGAYGAGS